MLLIRSELTFSIEYQLGTKKIERKGMEHHVYSHRAGLGESKHFLDPNGTSCVMNGT
jgi:prephenate dehydratase